MPSQNVIQLQETLHRRLVAMGAIQELGLTSVVSTTANDSNLSFILNFRNATLLTAFRNNIRTDFTCNYDHQQYACRITISETTRFTPETLELLLDNMEGFILNLAANPYILYRAYEVSGQNNTVNMHLVSPLPSQTSDVEETQLDNLDNIGINYTA